MRELVEKDENKKMMAMIMCGVRYQDDEYLIYSVRRDDKEGNIFISKLIKTSGGYVIANDFSNGEKEVLEGVVKRILNREDVQSLEKSGYYLIRDVQLVGVNSFSAKDCYVTTVPKVFIKDCLIYYDLVHEDVFNSPIVDVVDDKKFDGGFVGNLFLVIFGIFIIIFCISVVFTMFLK